MDKFNIIDFIILGLAGYGMIRGYFNGFIKQVASIIGLILGILGAKLYSYKTAAILKAMFDISDSTLKPISYLITFLGIVLICHFFANILRKITKFVELGGIDQIMGVIFGGLKYALIVSVIINVFDIIDKNSVIIDNHRKENSVFYNKIKGLAPSLLPFVKSDYEFNLQKKNEDANKIEV